MARKKRRLGNSRHGGGGGGRPTYDEVFHQRQAFPVVRIAEPKLPVRVEAARVHIGVRPRHHQRVVLSASDRLFSRLEAAEVGGKSKDGGGIG